MTWEEVREYLKENNALLIPVGTCEQHGKHSPLGTDSLVVEKICEMLSDKYNVLIAPIINYGIHFDVDSDYPGAASLKAKTIKSIFSELRETWVRQGFKKLIVVTFHGVPEHLETLENLGDN
jgi:creatinine amidohydrolase